ncbi:MAG: hypothetical protein CMO80_03890 [Verrucomicrobiales bacterium]|nr:hypothetical protein [Verrucomicrobiales bacterium]
MDNADWEVADGYLKAVEAPCDLLALHPGLGPKGDFRHPRLQGWRFYLIHRPYQKHLIFYEVDAEGVIFRRAMHGHRDLPNRLVERPG